MKKLIFIALSFVLVSCSLEEDKTAIVSPNSFYQTLAECQAGVRGCYQPLRSIYNKEFNVATEACTDLMNASLSGTKDAHLDISPATPRFGSTMWKQAYIGIRNANMCIEGIENSSIDEDKKAPLIGEAKIMRAFYYYLLTSLFNGVPYYTDVIRTEQDLDRIEKLPRTDADLIRSTCIEELQACVGDMTIGRSYDVDAQHVGYSFAQMLIAKMALWNKDYATAEEALRKIVSCYGELTQERYPLEDVCFSRKNTPESIFEIQHQYELGGLNVTGNLSSIMTPRKNADGNADADKDIYDGVSIPELGSESRNYTSFKINKYYYQALMPRGGEDLRTQYNLAWEWKGQQFTSATTRPWPGPKFWCWNMVSTYDNNNYPVFRYADAVLMLSEVCNETERQEEAFSLLNAVRKRAGLDALSGSMSKQAFLEEIQRERARELLGEFQRKFDLVRWGVWYSQTYNNNENSELLSRIRPCHRYYPIPDSEVLLSGGALDNEEYDKYMK